MAMNRVAKQTLGLSVFAAACLAAGMGLSYHWVGQAQEEKPVTVDVRNAGVLPPIAEVAEKLNPTVVAIKNTTFVKSRSASGFRNEGPSDEFFDFFFGPRRPMPMPREEERRLQAGGSGVVISPDGEILTNNHVVEGIRGGDAEIEVALSDSRTFKAKILGRDRELDLALIKIDARHLPFAKLGDSDAAKVGEWVVAIGNPLGLTHTVTQGIISAKGRTARQLGNGSGVEAFLQTDAAINRGNSGGPLLNLKGEVIGINTAIRADGQNIGFAVPVNQAKRILKDLRAGRPVSRGALGISLAELDAAFQDSLGVKEGVVVSEVFSGQAADKAKVERLDVITAIDGEPVRSQDDLVGIVSSRRAGDRVVLSVVREGKRKEIPVVLGDRKDLQEGEDDGQDGEREGSKEDGGRELDLEKTYGFKVAPLTPATRHQYRLAEDRKGVVVVSVSTRSDAAEKLAVGNVISAVGTRDVETLAQFNAEVKKLGGKSLILKVQASQGPAAITVAIPPR